MEEIWKKIDGYDDYSVSNYGKVRRDSKNLILKNGVDSSNGYPVVTLFKNKKGTKQHTHALVAKAFLPNPENKRTVNHIDCDKQNNIVTNLEWATDSEQMKHAFKNGLCENTRKQAVINLFGKTRKDWSDNDLQKARDRITALNKRPKTEKQLAASRNSIMSDNFRTANKIAKEHRHPAIKVIETGEIWQSQRDLATHLGIGESAICAVLHGRRPQTNGYHFEYV